MDGAEGRQDDDRRQPKSTVKKRHYCCICNNYRGKLVNGRCVTLHRFPADEKLRKAWISRLKTVSPYFKLNMKNDRLCSFHFETGCFTMDNPVPNVFTVNNAEKVFKVSKIGDESLEDMTEMDTNERVPVPMEVEGEEESEGEPVKDKITPEALSVMLHDYCKEQNQKPLEFLNKEIQTWYTTKRYLDASTQTETLSGFIETSTQTTTSTTKDVGIQAKRPDMTIEDVADDDTTTMFYTGIPNASTFHALFDEMDDVQTDNDMKGRPKALRTIDEFFMVLMRLRLGLLIQDLATRFHISKSTCSDIISKWIAYLSVKLQFLLQWPSREVIRSTMPAKFKRYPKLRVIIDCTEINTETPQSLKNKSLLFSHYKSHMTYKALIGISPNGLITFVSDLWVGSISDKQITAACGILDLLQPGDQLMADKGFLISDLTTERGISLVIPPLRTHRFMRREIEKTRRIANLRIYVEMAIERVKNFRIFQGTIPITLAQQVSQMWKICAALTNLQPPLVTK